jgi:LemA protein
MSWDPHAHALGVPAIAPRKTPVAVWLAVALVLLAPPVAALALHNGLISKGEAADAAWAQVESAYQRRADLVPVLVETVKRHMRHEAETLVAVVEARGAARATLGGQAPAGAAELAQLSRAEGEIGLGIRRLVALAEAHPELHSADSFLELQAQLEGAENRIHVARVAFNEAVRDYNAAIQKLPGAWIAQRRGLERRAYFESENGAQRAEPLGLD